MEIAIGSLIFLTACAGYWHARAFFAGVEGPVYPERGDTGKTKGGVSWLCLGHVEIAGAPSLLFETGFGSLAMPISEFGGGAGIDNIVEKRFDGEVNV